jgi:hypothetical protein
VPALSAGVSVDVLANDQNADAGETMTIVSASQGAKGKVTITDAGTRVRYVPNGCSVGSDTFSYRIDDGTGGQDVATVLLTITRDTVKPIASAPVTAFVAGSTLGTTTVPVRLSWCATDPGSGIARYQLDQSTDGHTFAAVALPSARTTSLSRSLTAGHRYGFRIRATDGDGSIGSYAGGLTSLVTRTQETATSVHYSGTWSSANSTTASSGKVRYTTKANASATFSFTGRAFALVSPTSSIRGSIKVYVDGTLVATVSEKTSTAAARRVVYARLVSAGTHTLKLVAVGNGRVDLDALLTLS